MKNLVKFLSYLIIVLTFTSCVSQMMYLDYDSYEAESQYYEMELTSEPKDVFKVYKFQDGGCAFFLKDSKTSKKINVNDLSSATILNPEETEVFLAKLNGLIDACDSLKQEKGLYYNIDMFENKKVIPAFDTGKKDKKAVALPDGDDIYFKHQIIKMQARSKKSFKKNKVFILYSDKKNKQISLKLDDVKKFRNALSK